jgi:hypothetical protein
MNQNQVLLFALASVPTMLTVLIGILLNNSRLGDMNSRLGDMNSRIDDLRSHMDARFDDMRVTWHPNCTGWKKSSTRASNISKSASPARSSKIKS